MSGPAAEEAAPAKVNLFLHVTGRRPDGYHTLDSLVVFAAIADRLSVQPAGDLALVIDGPFAAAVSSGDDNLVLRAARALAKIGGVAPGARGDVAPGARGDVMPGARLSLTKNLPVAAGLGGGSADAAAALRLLGQVWGVRGFASLASSLGADVPVCLASRPARMGGIGEILAPAPCLPPCGLCLVNPGVALSTASVFATRTGAFSAPAALPSAWSDATRMAADLARLCNDLEAAAIALCPPVRLVLQALASQSGALLARMSGSGATCFGLFPDIASAVAAAARLAHPGWWCWGGGLAAPAVSEPLYAGSLADL